MEVGKTRIERTFDELPKHAYPVVFYTADVKENLLMDNIDTQIKKCDRYIKLQTKWTLVDHFDEGLISKHVEIMKRPKIKEIIEQVCREKITLLIVYSIASLGGNSDQFSKFSLFLRNKGVYIYSLKEKYTTSTIDGKLLTDVFNGVDRYNLEIIEPIHLLFAGNSTSERGFKTFKMKFRTIYTLKHFLENNKEDTWLQIVPLSSMEISFEYSADTSLYEERETILEKIADLL